MASNTEKRVSCHLDLRSFAECAFRKMGPDARTEERNQVCIALRVIGDKVKIFGALCSGSLRW
jgi:hypothetical protein